MEYEFAHLACGGTFDFLHKGHKAFLDFAFDKSGLVTIGLASDGFISTSKIGVNPQAIRLAQLKAYLKENGYEKRSKIIVINDVYGSAISDKTIDGILATKLTINGAILVNKKRKELGLSPLRILEFSIVDADDNKTVSSTRIKNGQIDRMGKSYFLKIHKDFFLPKNLRDFISKPHGLVFGKIEDIPQLIMETNIVSVGDQTTTNFLARGICPNLSIIDLKIRRRKVFRTIWDLGFKKEQKFIEIYNEAAVIRKKMVELIYNYFSQEVTNRSVIKVLGEEDLAVLPAVILAPLGWTVIYGQPSVGLVTVSVNEETKSEFLEILSRFKSS